MSRLIVCLMAVCSILADQKIAQEKYDFLLSETLKDPNGVVRLTDKELHRFLGEFPRDYDVIIFLTIQNCQYCKSIEDAFMIVATAYKESKSYLASRISGTSEIRKPLFFLHTVTNYRSSFFEGNFKLKSFPNIYLSRSEEIFITDEHEKQNYMDIFFWRITPSDVTINEAKIIEWIRRLRNDNVNIKPSIFGFLKVLAIILPLIATLALIFIYAEKIVLNEKLWLFGSLIIFMISAGGFYSALHMGAPFIGSKKGEPEFFMAGNRAQYGIEGFIIIGGLIVAGGILILLTHLLKIKFENSLAKFLVVGLLSYAFVLIIGKVEEIFSSKNFYNPNFLPPAYYIRGSYYRDQGIVQ